MPFRAGETVRFAGVDSQIMKVGTRGGRRAYLIENGDARLPMWVPKDILEAHQDPAIAATVFTSRAPHLVAVDDFFQDPDQIRAFALAQEYGSDLRYYKGLRTYERFLWPYLREEFERLIGQPVTEWLGHTANGVFQQTSHDDPLVWHHDEQRYAAAVYLTPDPPPGSGTSFWRDRTCGCRRRPSHPLEQRRLGSAEAVTQAESVIYDSHNVVDPANWELIESVAGLYNRLVIWDASLIHSATSYEGFAGEGKASTRLVQLFFFDA